MDFYDQSRMRRETPALAVELARIKEISKTESYETIAANYLALIEIYPDVAEAYQLFALYALSKEMLDDAAKIIEAALSLRDRHAYSYYIRGRIFQEFEFHDLAIRDFETSLSIEKRDPVIYHLGLSQLTVGNLEEGSKNYSKREFPKETQIYLSVTEWDGSDKNSRILVWAEQGLGDELMFYRLLPCLENFVAEFTVQCDRRLRSTLTKNFPRLKFVSRDDEICLSNFDFQLPMGDLLRLFFHRLSDEDIRCRNLSGIHLFSTPQIEKQTSSVRKVGVSWLSMSSDRGALRSMPIDMLLRALSPETDVLINLQYLPPQCDIELIRDRGFRLLDNVDCFNDIDGALSAASACDIIVTVDNSVLHMGGALGCPTIGLIPREANWRWGQDGERSYWYSSVRLLRQTHRRSWVDVISRLRGILA